MKRTLYEGYEGPRLPPTIQMQRIRRVIEKELTTKQREILLAYYFQDKNIPRSPPSAASIKAASAAACSAQKNGSGSA